MWRLTWAGRAWDIPLCPPASSVRTYPILSPLVGTGAKGATRGISPEMKVSLLRGLLLLSVLTLAAAFPSPAKLRSGRDGEPELSKKKLTKRQEEEMYFDLEDIGRYSLISRVALPGMEDASEENGTLWDCLGCCVSNATQDQLPQNTMKEGGQGGGVIAYNINMLPGLKINITDSLNSTIGRCVGCCNNGTMNETKETGEVRKERGTGDPHI
ncbi:hypothetical protein NDU88_003874 [Pleurodeles waltl]|uniref:Uncharacterized protein n=1 Tax=Pleurodeles waltl TaxID=8319 RepID=A0AAV7M5J3_PLEWA|nr:hypothetical protein NDU88_003874 [Pleurodeles waltl]